LGSLERDRLGLFGLGASGTDLPLLTVLLDTDHLIDPSVGITKHKTPLSI